MRADAIRDRKSDGLSPAEKKPTLGDFCLVNHRLDFGIADLRSKILVQSRTGSG
jgi:hypothetical protein